MIKIQKILDIKPYKIISLFNNGEIKMLNVLPLIEKHKKLKGIDKLLDATIFNNATLGEFTEIMWQNIVENKNGELWNYDISPEFFYENGVYVNLNNPHLIEIS